MLNNRIQNRLSAEHIAYCAGLFDGEGCVQYKFIQENIKVVIWEKYGVSLWKLI
jgi:hypothetical protein